MKMLNTTKTLLTVNTGDKRLFASLLATLILALTATTAKASTNPLVDIDSSDVRYKVENGVATIFGTAEDMIEKQLIERIVQGFTDVDEVRNEVELIKPQPDIEANIDTTSSDR